MAIIIKHKHNSPPPDALVSDKPQIDQQLPGTLPTTEIVSTPKCIKPKTLADVISLIPLNQALPASRKRDLISACNSIARLIGQPPYALPADVSTLRNLIVTLHPAQGRISQKRLANIRADLTAALEVSGVTPPSDPPCPPNLDWATFLGQAAKKHQAWFLSRFSRYCSHRNISPVDVTDDTVRGFRHWLEKRLLTNDPNKIVKQTAVSFNVIIKCGCLPIPLLTTASGTRFCTRPLEDYPPSLVADIESYLKRLRDPDLFSDDGPRRPLRSTSLRNIKAHIRQFLHAAVEAGHQKAHFKTLSNVVDLEVIECAFGHMVQRHNGQIPTGLGNIISTLMAIARYYLKLDATVLRKIALAQKKIGDQLGTNMRTMSCKSQTRMDQFAQRENIVRLVNLPMNLISKASNARSRRSAALDAMTAAAIAILLCCPMRVKNLAGLRFSEDFTVVRKGKAVTINIHVPADKTKGRMAIDAAIEGPYATVV
ncbi:hypothetical protein [Asticcacaulis tiandongensis]|uniref:hypothetical protein n=1 Tax=Asticcacaulis tiandongensis TaxID=2565365 RepID=UPI001129BA63|nr:hypothetical protein [Asticcacaulis tiandongensis]